MSITPEPESRKCRALRMIDEVWELHGPRGQSGPAAGCLAFVVDHRHVAEDGIELRLAVSFGEKLFPAGSLKGVLTPHPLPGRYRFGIHLVGTRGGRIGLLDQWYDAREAAGLEDPGAAEVAARAILGGITDEDYARHVSSDRLRPGPVCASAPFALDGREMAHDFEP